MLNFTVLKMAKVDGKPQLRAYFDFSVNGELSLNGIRLMDDGKGYWVAFPQNCYEANGTKKFKPIMEACDNVKKEMKRVMLEHYQNNN